MPERVNPQNESQQTETRLSSAMASLSPEVISRYMNLDNPMYSSMMRRVAENTMHVWSAQELVARRDDGTVCDTPIVRVRPYRNNESIRWDTWEDPRTRRDLVPAIDVSALDILHYERIADPMQFGYTHLLVIRCTDERVPPDRNVYRTNLQHDPGSWSFDDNNMEPVPTRLADNNTTFIPQGILHHAIRDAKAYFDRVIGVNRFRDTKRHAGMTLQESVEHTIAEADAARKESREYRTRPTRRFQPCKRRATSGRSGSITSFSFSRFPHFFRLREQWHTSFIEKEKKRNRKPLKESVRKLYGFKPWFEERY